ncbi:MAG TPA: phage protein Gp27 family protein [Phycisphaerae bacterium]|nr:phage protein Gp27 family protein [Phycisphaerae bacterium]
MKSGRKSTVYNALSVAAARACKLNPATAHNCADRAECRSLRDSYWAQMDRRLNDPQTYTLDQIVEWAKAELGATISRSAIDRARAAELRSRQAVTDRGALAVQVANALGDRGELDALKAGRVLASQLIFSALEGMSPGQLDDLEPNQVIRLIGTLGYLSKASAETDMLRQKLAEMQAAFDAQVAARTKKSTDGRLTADDIADIRKAVFGAEAA